MSEQLNRLPHAWPLSMTACVMNRGRHGEVQERHRGVPEGDSCRRAQRTAQAQELPTHGSTPKSFSAGFDRARYVAPVSLEEYVDVDRVCCWLIGLPQSATSMQAARVRLRNTFSELCINHVFAVFAP